MTDNSAGQGDLVIPGYRDFSLLGRGASSTVYRCHDEELNRWVAVKVFLADDPEDPARKRFRREREITANLGKHPHIVQVLGTGFSAGGLPYVVMELFEQGSIADRIQAAGAFSVTDTIDIGAKIADALCAAHKAGVLHRDIKPQNILLSEYGPALADFGIARSATNLEWSQSLEQLTPWHAAPEILSGGPPTQEADVYALGSTLYAMLAGRPAFAGAPGESLLRYQVRATEEPLPPLARSDVSPELFAVLATAMAKDPRDRYRSSADLRDALRSLTSVAATAQGSPQSPWAPKASTPTRQTSDLSPTWSKDAPLFSDTQQPADPQAPTLRDAQTILRSSAMRERTTPSAKEPSNSTIERAVAGASLEDNRSGPQPELTHQLQPNPEARSPHSPITASIPLDLQADGSKTITRTHSYTSAEEELQPQTQKKHLRIGILVATAAVLVAAIAVVVVAGSSQRSPKVIKVSTQQTIPVETSAAPVSLHATTSPNGSSVELQWTTGSVPPDGYVVLKVPGGNATPSLVHPGPSASATLFNVGGLDPTTSYCFIVIALVGSHDAEAPSCACIRGATLSPQHVFPHLSCS